MGLRFAIADPPYLGRANRWYGDGRGIQGGRGRADSHPDAALWDTVAAHHDLVRTLRRDYDGYAIACPPDSLAVYLAVAPELRVMVWHRRNAPPSGARVGFAWEAVLVAIPADRRGRKIGIGRSDVLDATAPRIGFAGAKPEAWTRWVLDVMGVEPEDAVVDLFAGSGAVSDAIAQGVLPL